MLGLLADLATGGVEYVEAKARSLRRIAIRGATAVSAARFAMWFAFAAVGLMLSGGLVALAGPLGYPIAAVITGGAALAVAGIFLGVAKVLGSTGSRRTGR